MAAGIPRQMPIRCIHSVSPAAIHLMWAEGRTVGVCNCHKQECGLPLQSRLWVMLMETGHRGSFSVQSAPRSGLTIAATRCLLNMFPRNNLNSRCHLSLAADLLGLVCHECACLFVVLWCSQQYSTCIMVTCNWSSLDEANQCWYYLWEHHPMP